MPSVVRRKKQKSEDQILDEATMRLLRSVKSHAKAKGKPIGAEELRREGYSDRFIAKVEKA